VRDGREPRREPLTARAPAWFRWLAPPGVALAVLLAFRPALEGEFLDWDDRAGVADNVELQAPLREALPWMFGACHMGHYHPLTWLSFRFDLAQDGGVLRARTCHRTNLALHALGAIAFAFLAERLLRRAFPSNSATSIACAALLGALFWALHPLRVESVAWITERRDVLSGALLTFAVLLWVRWIGPRPAPELSARRRLLAIAGAALAAGFALISLERGPSRLDLVPHGGWGLLAAAICLAVSSWAVASGAPWRFALCVLLALLSLLAKAWGIALPAILLVLDAVPLRRSRGPTRAWIPLALEKLPLVALSAIFGSLAVWAQSSQADAMPSWGEHTLAERSIQALHGLAFPLWKTLAPFDLLALYEIPDRVELGEPRFALGALAVLLVFGLAALFARRAPGALAGLACMAILLAPVLGFFQAGPQFVADRHSYLAAMPLALLAAAGLLAWSAGHAWRARASIAVASIALVALGAATREQSRVWRNTETLWTHVLEREPGHMVANLSLGNERMRQAALQTDPRESARLLRVAQGLFERGFHTRADPRFLAKLSGVERALAAVEPERAPEHLEAARVLSERAAELALATGRVGYEARRAHAASLIAQSRLDEAQALLAQCLGERPEDASARMLLGQLWMLRGDPARALSELETAARLDPEQSAAWRELASARRAVGEIDAAREALERALLLDPGDARAQAMLRELVEQAPRSPEAGGGDRSRQH
jgi:protein O-mannosyl-transferase